MNAPHLAPFAAAALAVVLATTLPAAATADIAPPNTPRRKPVVVKDGLEEVAASARHQWTGIAIARDGRIFVTYPRWNGPHELSLAVLGKDGTPVAYPDAEWNAWKPGSDKGVADHFVCVQSVRVDAANHLWVLDPGAPKLAALVPGAPKLVEIDLATDKVLRTIRFDTKAAPEGSYLNDVRVDSARQVAYLTDSGLGALLVVDLGTGTARRLLEDHPSTKAEADVIPKLEGKELRVLLPDGTPGPVPQVHADGIALDLGHDLLYFCALTSKTLYRVKASLLADPKTTKEALVAALEKIPHGYVCDGLEVDAAGHVYLTDLEGDAVSVMKVPGLWARLAHDPRIAWPDSLAFGPDGALYVTAAQIHRTPPFSKAMPETPFRILRLAPLPW